MVDIELLKDLCNADGIASNEEEIRAILIKDINGQVSFDGLGSIIVKHSHSDDISNDNNYSKNNDNKTNNNSNKFKGPKLMFCAHIDEVGFMVRHISDIGMLHLMQIGGVKDSAKSFQPVNVTLEDGKKVRGLMNCSYDDKNKVKDVYVDIGLSSREEVLKAGVNIGDMVCFASNSEMINENVLMAKALDDRVGCYILKEVDRRLKSINHNNDVYLSFTSSEEVGTRGGKCSADIVNPDVIFAIDVACAPDLVRNYTNQRQLSKGCMIVHYDKTMIPNKKFLKFIKDVAIENNISFQCDMFSGGGTDAANSHLVNGGKLAIVLGIPLRYCHGSYSMADLRDVEELIELIINIIKTLDVEKYEVISSYL